MKRGLMLLAMGALLVYATMTLQPANPIAAQTDVRTPRPSVVTVTEEAQVTTAPDRAMIELGVVTQAPNARAAAAENATRTDKVIAAVRGAVKSGAKIETTNYSLSPNYDYPREGGQPRLTGYTASNTVRVTTDNLREVGPVIDAAVGASANNVQNLIFTLKDRHSAETRALKDAAGRAREKANAVASALGLKVIRVLEVTESGAPTPMPFYGRGIAMEQSANKAPTQIQPGDIDVRAQVTMTVEVGP